MGRRAVPTPPRCVRRLLCVRSEDLRLIASHAKAGCRDIARRLRQFAAPHAFQCPAKFAAANTRPSVQQNRESRGNATKPMARALQFFRTRLTATIPGTTKLIRPATIRQFLSAPERLPPDTLGAQTALLLPAEIFRSDPLARRQVSALWLACTPGSALCRCCKSRR